MQLNNMSVPSSQSLQALNNFISGLKSTQRNLPNNGGSYSTPAVNSNGQSNFASSTTTSSLPAQQPIDYSSLPPVVPPNMNSTTPSGLPTKEMPQEVPWTPAPIQTPAYDSNGNPNFSTTPTPVTPSESDSFNYGGSAQPSSTSTSTTTTSTTPPAPPEAIDPLQKYQDLALEQAMNSSQGTGLYALKDGVAYSPEQIMTQRKSADAIYNQRLGEYANMIKDSRANTKTPAYGADSDLAGLSTNSVNTIYKMSDAFNSHPIVKDFNIIQKASIDANNLIKQSNDNLKKGIKPTAAEDLQLIYMFAKAQDPNSVVREGEYNTVANYVSTLPQDIQSQISRVWAKQPTAKLTPEARNAILHGIDRKYNADKQQYTQLRKDAIKHITGIAGKDVSDTFLNNYEGAESSSGSSNSASGDAVFDF